MFHIEQVGRNDKKQPLYNVSELEGNVVYLTKVLYSEAEKYVTSRNLRGVPYIESYLNSNDTPVWNVVQNKES